MVAAVFAFLPSSCRVTASGLCHSACRQPGIDEHLLKCKRRTTYNYRQTAGDSVHAIHHGTICGSQPSTQTAFDTPFIAFGESFIYFGVIRRPASRRIVFFFGDRLFGAPTVSHQDNKTNIKKSITSQLQIDHCRFCQCGKIK